MPVGNLCVRGRGEACSPVSGHPVALLGFGARGHGNNSKQDRQALLKAKYCPRVSAALCTHKTHKNSRDLDLWPMTLKFNSVLEVVEIHVLANFHQAACSGSWVIVFTAFLAMVRNPKSRSCYLDLWPMTLKFSGFLGVVKMHVPAKLRQANCSGSWVIVRTEKKLEGKQYCLSLPRTRVTHKNRESTVGGCGTVKWPEKSKHLEVEGGTCPSAP